MLPQRRPISDRSSESLEARLRALPPPPVPVDLEARILAAIPAEPPNKMPRVARGFGRRPLAAWAGAAAVVVAVALLAVLLRRGPDTEKNTPNVVSNTQNTKAARQVKTQQPGYALGVTSWLRARRDLDPAESPLFIWPIQEKSPLMVSSTNRLDLLD
jgi:hypothetical protein